jgi:porin
MNGPAFLIAEAGYQRNGLPGDQGKLGTYKVGAYYDANRFTEFETPLTTRQGNWGYYTQAEQVIYQTDTKAKYDMGQEKKDTGDKNANKRGIGVFSAIIVAPDETVNTMPFFCDGGVIWRGPFEQRPTDSIGFAMIYGRFSDDLRNAEQIAQTLDSSIAVQDYELVFEWCYRFRMREGALYFQPDLQYIRHPDGNSNIPNAFVVGCQMGINF